ncbi:MAG: DUF1491 family protein [Pseudomonadota bacterium]
MQRDARLRTGIWIDALIRRAQVGGAFALVSRSGDRDAGSVLVAVRSRDALFVYMAERDMDGRRVWRSRRVDEAGLQQEIAQRTDFDPDLNVIEIDDAQGRHFIEETVMGSEEAQEDAAAASAEARALFQDR